MKKHYITILGQCGKDENEIQFVRDVCMKVSHNYKAKYHGIIRDISLKDIATFSTTFIVECHEEEFVNICNNFVKELENEIHISSMQSGTI